MLSRSSRSFLSKVTLRHAVPSQPFTTTRTTARTMEPFPEPGVVSIIERRPETNRRGRVESPYEAKRLRQELSSEDLYSSTTESFSRRTRRRLSVTEDAIRTETPASEASLESTGSRRRRGARSRGPEKKERKKLERAGQWAEHRTTEMLDSYRPPRTEAYERERSERERSERERPAPRAYRMPPPPTWFGDSPIPPVIYRDSNWAFIPAPFDQYKRYMPEASLNSPKKKGLPKFDSEAPIFAPPSPTRSRFYADFNPVTTVQQQTRQLTTTASVEAQQQQQPSKRSKKSRRRSGGDYDPRTRPARIPVRNVPVPTEEYMTLASEPPADLAAPQKLLVILDLNGTLMYRPGANRSKSPILRPGLKQFRKYLFKNFHVMVWTSARPENAEYMVQAAFSPAEREQLLGVWARDTLGLTDIEYNQRTQVYKRLTRVWEGEFMIPGVDGGVWNQTNTVLFDDTDEKAKSHPFNLVCVPEFIGDKEDNVLEQCTEYLEELKWKRNVSAYIRHAPFRTWK